MKHVIAVSAVMFVLGQVAIYGATYFLFGREALLPVFAALLVGLMVEVTTALLLQYLGRK